jgi:DedD protein
MAFFKFRKASGEQQASAESAPSIDEIRQRAKYRLVGASILVVAGVVVFPLLFDKQPRPLAVDTPIVISSQKGVPMAAPTLPVPTTPAPAANGQVKAADAGKAPAEAIITEKREPESKPLAQAPVAAVVDAPVKATDKPAEKSADKPVAKASDKPVDKTKGDAEAKRAQALLEGKAAAKPSAAADAGRFVVQVGAFAESARAQEVRNQIERAGMKTYTQVAQSKDGPRIRVRVGPFGQKAEAEKAAEQIKKLKLPTAILSL